MTAENGIFAQQLAGNEIIVGDSVDSVYLRVKVCGEVYSYFYSLDGQNWHEVPVKLDSYKLSDDFVSGGGFFTGAFVGMHVQDMQDMNLHADFDYFRYEELD